MRITGSHAQIPLMTGTMQSRCSKMAKATLQQLMHEAFAKDT